MQLSRAVSSKTFDSPVRKIFQDIAKFFSRTLHLFSDELITNIAAIVKGASLVKINRTSVGVGQFSKKPKLEITRITDNVHKAVTSKLTFSITKDKRAEKRSANAIAVSIPLLIIFFTEIILC